MISVIQSTNAVLMIRPYRFYPNPETAADNAFQQRVTEDVEGLSVAARSEFDAAVQILRQTGVTVHVFDDTATPETPDAVFPNNWISTHHDGRVALFPMYSALRRRERRHDIIDALRQWYCVTAVVDYSSYEQEDRCLEGTGSLVLDHVNKVASASLSKRSDPELVRRFAGDFGYEPVTFTAVNEEGQPVYHTNVMMCIGTEFALVGLNMIPSHSEREQVRTRLESTGKKVVELTREQIANFAGNAIELHNEANDKLLVLSARAVSTLTKEQLVTLTRYVRLIPLELPAIELGGGSARCMIATIHLPPL